MTTKMAADPRTRSFNFEAATAVVIDANEVLVKLYASILRGFGFHRVHVCPDIRTGAQIFNLHGADLLLIDPFHYADSAYEFIRWLRLTGRDRGSEASVLIVTARASHNMVIAARQAGVDYVVACPLSAYRLLERILWVAVNKHRRDYPVPPSPVAATYVASFAAR